MVRSRSGPTSTKETRDFSKIVSGFCPDNYDSLGESERILARSFALTKTYNYINWMFDYKFRMSPAVSGTQVFLVPSIMNEFERMYSAHLDGNKNKSKMDIFLAWIKSSVPDALDRFQLESRDDIALFVKYAENLTRKDEQVSLIMSKIIDMEL